MSAPSQSQLFLFEAFDLVSNTTVLGALYGIMFTLYCLCARSLYLQLQKPDKRRQARFTLGYISFALFCTTAYLALSAQMIQMAYINHPDFPGGPLGYETSHDSTFELYAIAGGVLDLAIKVVTMAIQIWRVRIIWSGGRYAAAVTILPLLLLFSYIALSIPTGILPNSVLFNQLGIPTQSFIVMVITKYAVLSALTILVTGLIIARILLVRRQCVKIIGTSNTLQAPYMSVVAMLVESYALESAWSIVSAILYGVKKPAVALFMGNDSSIKVIAYFLVVYRVATGRGWTSETERELTSLQWNRGVQRVTDEASGIQSHVPATTTVVAIGPPPTSHSESIV